MIKTKQIVKQSNMVERGFSSPVIHDKPKETKPEKHPENSKKSNNGK